MTETYVALDMEMTGPDPESDEIIEIGAIRFRGERVLGSWHTFVKPSAALPYKIRALTGIEDKDLQDAPFIFSVLPGLARFLKDYPVVGQSIERDMEFLSKPSQAIGIQFRNRQVDTFELATLLLSEMPKYDLQAVAKKLGVQSGARHRALADAEVSMNVFLRLVERLQRLDEQVLAEIARLAASVKWTLAGLFGAIAREKARTAFREPSGSTIRDLLVAKGRINEVDADFLRLSKEQMAEPLRPAESFTPLDADRTSKLLSRGGILGSAQPAYEDRPEQVMMLKSVVNAFNNGRHLLVEAGTGTGKTLAYLIPAAKFAQSNGRHVVIATKTINLQEQIKRSLQEVAGALAEDMAGSRVPLRFSVLKGRANYLCLRRWLAFRQRPNLTQADVKAIVKISLWLAESEEGDMAEMRLTSEEEETVWPRTAAVSDGCLGPKCPNQVKNRCFFLRARHKAESSHIVIANHALLMSDLASGNQVLPKYDYAVLDEAHDIESEATEQMTERIDDQAVLGLLRRIAYSQPDGQYDGLLADISRTLPKGRSGAGSAASLAKHLQECQEVATRASRAAMEFFRNLSGFAENHGGEVSRYARRLRITSASRAQPAWSNVEIAWENAAMLMDELSKSLSSAKSELDTLKGTRKDEVLAELESLAAGAGAFLSLSRSLVVSPDASHVYWVEVEASGRTRMCSTLLNVGSVLRPELFEKKSSVVLTSATLTTQHNFSYVRERLGILDADELMLGSSFDYGSSTLLCLPNDMPEPGQPGYQHWLAQALVDLCLASEGRALVLFTSHSALRSTYRALQPRLEEKGIMVLGQAIDGSRHRILSQFKQDPRCVLLGTASFWEGVDIPGDALSLLVITKLPFGVPTDPVFAARAEQFEDGFEQYSVPQAILRFKQGFGRLIRSRQDRGVVVILDRRVVSRSYGSAFMDSLPSCEINKGSIGEVPQHIASWLAPSN